jgi:hypothetical protein
MEIVIQAVVEPAMVAANFNASPEIAIRFAQAYEAGWPNLHGLMARDPMLRSRLTATEVSPPTPMARAWPTGGGEIATAPRREPAAEPQNAPQAIGYVGPDPNAMQGAPPWYQAEAGAPAVTHAPPQVQVPQQHQQQVPQQQAYRQPQEQEQIAPPLTSPMQRASSMVAKPSVVIVAAPPPPPLAPDPDVARDPGYSQPVRAAAAPRPTAPQIRPMSSDEIAAAGVILPLAPPASPPNGAGHD